MSDYTHMRPGEFWARMHKARDAGFDLEDHTLDEFLNLVPLTPEELAEAERRATETMNAILEMRASHT
jgi:hypothetical protein